MSADVNLATQSPVQIDTALAELYYLEGRAEQTLLSAEIRIHQTAGSRKNYTGRSGSSYTWSQTFQVALAAVKAVAETDSTYLGSSARRALDALDEAKTALRLARQEMVTLNEEFTRRGGWTRAFLVQQPNGHVHRSMACSTCYPTTRFVWLPEYSGQDETQIVEAAGERSCTVCYPSSPVEVLSRPTRMFGPDEITAQAAREARAVAKAAREQAKIDKALTVDGTPYRIRYDSQRYDGSSYTSSERFATEAAASQWVVGTIADGYPISEGKRAAMGQVIAAIADKHSITVDEVTADIDRKVVAKRKRDAR